MLKKRQAKLPKIAGPEEREFLVRTMSVNYSAGFRIDWHAHDWHQLIYACRGVMSVETGEGSWVVPQQRGVWVPAGVRHAITMSGQVQLRTLYLPQRGKRSLPEACAAVSITALLRELILRIVERGTLRRSELRDRHLSDLLFDEIRALPVAPLNIPMPRDSRAAAVAKIFAAEPGERASLEQIGQRIGASKRTIERLFVSETAMTFHRWRQQIRILHAVRKLADGDSVANISLELGYESPSAFISMFRRIIGTSPGKYFCNPAVQS